MWICLRLYSLSLYRISAPFLNLFGFENSTFGLILNKIFTKKYSAFLWIFQISKKFFRFGFLTVELVGVNKSEPLNCQCREPVFRVTHHWELPPTCFPSLPLRSNRSQAFRLLHSRDSGLSASHQHLPIQPLHQLQSQLRCHIRNFQTDLVSRMISTLL